MSFKITGTGSALPQTIVTNLDLEKIMETSDEWITTRTGITERHVLSTESLLSIAVSAAQNALEDANASPNEIDLLLVTTMQSDWITPSLCCLLSHELGISGHMFDLNMACTGFIFALEAADSYFRSGKAKKALIVSAEAMTRIANWDDRSTCVLFGDGAGAVVLEYDADSTADIRTTVRGDAKDLNVGASNRSSPFGSAGEAYPYVKMNGQEIYIYAVSSIIDEITAMLEAHSLVPNDISTYFLHQANIRIIDSARKKLHQPAEKFPICLDHCGNTSSASLPILLDETSRAGKIPHGGKIVICGFGAGLTSGAALMEWHK